MALGICVFLWGLSYKLSLYDMHPQTLQRVPEAKLLSKNEDSQAVQSVRQVIAKAEGSDSLQLIQPVLIAVAGACAECRSFDREETLASTAPTAIPLSGLFFRPPPIHFVL